MKEYFYIFYSSVKKEGREKTKTIKKEKGARTKFVKKSKSKLANKNTQYSEVDDTKSRSESKKNDHRRQYLYYDNYYVLSYNKLVAHDLFK